MSTSDLISELEKMNKSLDDPNPSLPKEEEEKEEEPKKEEELPKEEEKKEGEPKPEETPPKEEERKEEAKAEPTDLEKTIAELKSEIAALKAKPKEEEKPPEEKPPEEQVEDHDFVGNLDLDEVSRSSEELNKLLNKLYKKGMIDSKNAIMAKLPDLVRNQVEAVDTMRKAGETFYNQNEDLRAFQEVVVLVYDEEVKKNANRTIGEVFKDVAKEVRKRLKLPEPKPGEKKEEVINRDNDAPPKLPNAGSRAGKVSGEQEVSSVESDIDAMNKALG